MKIEKKSLPKKVNQYIVKIQTAWTKSVESILETARLLKQAKDDLSEIDYFDLSNNLPFSPSTIEKLISISNNKQINNPSNLESLPPHWTTLYELSLLPENVVKDELKTGNINPDVSRSYVSDIKNTTKNSKSSQSISKSVEPPQAKLASVLLPKGFDINKVEELQKNLEIFCKKNGVIVSFDGSRVEYYH